MVDALAVVNYILINASSNGKFVFDAADVNCDKKITIKDVVAIVNLILCE